MKKKWLIGGILGVMILGCSITGAVAYLSSHDRVNNKVGIGHNDTGIEEEFPDPTPIEPGADNTYTKKVLVKNSQSVPCFFRVAVSYSNSDIGNSVTLLKLDTENWVYLDPKDNEKLGGYYYYRSPVKPGESTLPLFDGVKIAAGADFSVPEENFDVIIYEESIQQTQGNTYEAAWNGFIRE